MLGRDQPVADLDRRVLRDIGPEEPVEDHDDPAEVLVEVFEIAAVVDAMGRRGVQNPLDGPEPGYQGRMQPELIGEVQSDHGEEGEGREADPDDRYEEQPGEGEDGCGGEPVGRGEGQLIGRMMDAMVRPEKFDPMRRAVIPVVGEFLQDDEQHPAPPAIHGHGVDAPVPDGGREDPDDHRLGDEAREFVGHGQDDGNPALGPGIGLSPSALVEIGLAEDRQDEDPVER